ncbi:MAG: nucleotide exchange factor GrpE [Candidatus Eremiobacterota bacterium]
MSFLSNFFENIFHRKEFEQLKGEVLDLRRKVMELEIASEEKENLIESLKKEYEAFQSIYKDNTVNAKEEELIEIFTEISPHLTQLNTMKKLDEKGKDIKIKDLFRLIKQIEKIFEKRGVIQIGEAGEKVTYNSSVHQPAGNMSLYEAEDVIIRFCGYKIQDKLIKRALVGKDF